MRSRKGLSQGELGKAVGTTQQTIAKIESSSPLYSKYYLALSEHFGVSVNYILKGEVNSISSKGSGPEIENARLIEIAEEALDKALVSYAAVSHNNGKLSGEIDANLLKQAFRIAIRGELTGDYVTASLITLL